MKLHFQLHANWDLFPHWADPWVCYSKAPVDYNAKWPVLRFIREVVKEMEKSDENQIR